MITGVGVDIVDLRRIAKKKESLAKKILTKSEYSLYLDCLTETRKIEFLGGRFAGKEAFFKAVSNPVPFTAIEILNDPSGKPYLNYDGVHISISHERKYAIAYVICEK